MKRIELLLAILILALHLPSILENSQVNLLEHFQYRYTAVRTIDCQGDRVAVARLVFVALIMDCTAVFVATTALAV